MNTRATTIYCFYPLVVLSALLVPVAAPRALEAVAQSSNQMFGNQPVLEAKLTVLTSKNDALLTKLTEVQKEVDGAIHCGESGKFYSPGASGADADGCVAPACE
jgi:hypothetical protein